MACLLPPLPSSLPPPSLLLPLAGAQPDLAKHDVFESDVLEGLFVGDKNLKGGR